MPLTKQEQILRLVDACKDLGWEMVIPNVDMLEDDDEIPGMVIGKADYIAQIIDMLPPPIDLPKETIH